MLTRLADALLSHIYSYCTQREKLTQIQRLNKQLHQHLLSSPRHFVDDYLCITYGCLDALKASHSLCTALSGVHTLTIPDVDELPWFLSQSQPESQSLPLLVVCTSTSTSATSISPRLLLFTRVVQLEMDMQMNSTDEADPAAVLFGLFSSSPQSFQALTRMKLTEYDYQKMATEPNKLSSLIYLTSLRVLSMSFRVCRKGLEAILSSTPQVIQIDLSRTKVRYVSRDWTPPSQLAQHRYQTLLLPDMESAPPTTFITALTRSRTDPETQTELPSPLECLHIVHSLHGLAQQGCWLMLCSNLRVLICDHSSIWFEQCISLCNTAASAQCQLTHLLAFAGFNVRYDLETGMTRQQIDDLSAALCRLLGIMPSLGYLRLIDPDVDLDKRANPVPLNVSTLMEKVNTLPLIHLRFLDSGGYGGRKVHLVTLPVSLSRFVHLQSFYMDSSDFSSHGEWDRLFTSMPQLLQLTLGKKVYAHLGMLLAIGKHCRQLLSLPLDHLISNDQVNYSSTSETLAQAAAAAATATTTTTSNVLFPHLLEVKFSVDCVRDIHCKKTHLILVQHLLPLFSVHASTTQFLTVKSLADQPIDAQQLLINFPDLKYLEVNHRRLSNSNTSDSTISQGWMSVWRPRQPPVFIPSICFTRRSVAEVRKELDNSYHGCYMLMRKPQERRRIERDTDVRRAKRSRSSFTHH